MPNLSCYTMQVPIQHMYKPSHEGSGLLYAWFLSMHTRVDIILYSKKTEGELLFVVNCIYDALCRLEKMANFYNPASELAYVNRTAVVSPVVLSEELYSMIDFCLECVIENALINMGNSSVLALGNHPVGTGWKVNNILLHNECLTTSGNDSPERRHIVSPRDGKLVEGARQISVVTTNGAIGEILSTALFAADGEQRKALMGIYAHCRVYISTVLY